MALGHIDYYALKPFSTPDELFHRLVSEFLQEWRRQNAPGRRELTVVADPWSPAGYALRNLLARNGVPHAFHTPDSEEGVEFLRVVQSGGSGRAGRDASRRFGARRSAGGGPRAARHADADRPRRARAVRRRDRRSRAGGLAAAVYASSEGLNALVVERESIGGQAGSSTRIRNYLGFSRGLSGAELAQRAYQQAWVFGATFLLTREVEEIGSASDTHRLDLRGRRRGAQRHPRDGCVVSAAEVPALESSRASASSTARRRRRRASSRAERLRRRRRELGRAGRRAPRRYAPSVTLVCRGVALGDHVAVPPRRDPRQGEHPRARRPEVVDAAARTGSRP